MTVDKIYSILQFNGGTFPTGGFSQSFGLETYVTDGLVHDAESFNRFLATYLAACIGKCEGPIIAEAQRLTAACISSQGGLDEDSESMARLKELEVLSNASKVTKESREAGLRMGKAFCRIMASVLEDERFDRIVKCLGRDISYPVAYGIVCCLMEVETDQAVRGYIYSTANTLVQSAVKLVPLGNTEAQVVLHKAIGMMEEALELSLATPVDDITNFCPGLDIAGIRHETLAVRLYMS